MFSSTQIWLEPWNHGVRCQDLLVTSMSVAPRILVLHRRNRLVISEVYTARLFSKGVSKCVLISIFSLQGSVSNELVMGLATSTVSMASGLVPFLRPLLVAGKHPDTLDLRLHNVPWSSSHLEHLRYLPCIAMHNDFNAFNALQENAAVSTPTVKQRGARDGRTPFETKTLTFVQQNNQSHDGSIRCCKSVHNVANLVGCGLVSLQLCKLPNPDLVSGFKHVQATFIIVPVCDDDPNRHGSVWVETVIETSNQRVLPIFATQLSWLLGLQLDRQHVEHTQKTCEGQAAICAQIPDGARVESWYVMMFDDVSSLS